MVEITVANILTYVSANREVETDKRPVNYQSLFRESSASQLATNPLNFNGKSEVTQEVEKDTPLCFTKALIFA